MPITKNPAKASAKGKSAQPQLVNTKEFQSVAYRGAVPLKAFVGWVSLILLAAILVGGLSANLLVNQRLGQLVAETATRVELQAQGRAGAVTEWATSVANLGKSIEKAEIVRIFATESARVSSPANAPQMANVAPDMVNAVMQQKPYMQQLMDEFVSRNKLYGAQLVLPSGQVLLAAGSMPQSLPKTALEDVVRQAQPQVMPLYKAQENIGMTVLRPVQTLADDDQGAVVAVLWYSLPVGEKLSELMSATRLDKQGERSTLLQGGLNMAEVVGRNALGEVPERFADIQLRLGQGGDSVRVVQPSLVDNLPVFATLRTVQGTPFAVLQEYTAKDALGVMALYKPGIYLIMSLLTVILASLMLALTLHLMGQRNRTRVKLLGQTMDALVRVVEARDPFLSGHHTKVARLAVQVGNRLEMTVGERATLYYAAQLASVGRLLVPQGVLSKKGKLTDAERQSLEDHINQAVKVLGDIEFDLPIMPVISQMYEREDGTGHPQGLKADAIIRMAKVLGACDAFVAMTSDRAHRKALTKAEALKAMSGTAFAPDVTAAIKSERS